MGEKVVIRLLGIPEVQIGGWALPPLRTKKGLSLLALLVLAHGKPLARTRLAVTLWPDSTEAAGLANLRRTLTDLRHALGESAAIITTPDAHTLALNTQYTQSIWADVWAWEQFPRVSLYRGAFLDGIEEEWVYDERTRWESAYLSLKQASTLPIPSRLIGRDEAVDEVVAQLVAPQKARMVTLVGPGGVGKTSVAKEVARLVTPSFLGGVVWVDLATLPHHANIAPTLLAASGEQFPQEPCLFVLDNAEHVQESVACLLKTLSHDYPQVTFLVTSRLPLGMLDECLCRLSPLTPIQAETLFLLRARQAGVVLEAATEHPTILQLCEKLDGLPLLIEIAASRTVQFSPAQMLTQATFGLEKTLRWSWDLLTAPEQDALTALSILRGDWDMATACAITEQPDRTIHALVRHSLIRHEGKRFRLLETVRDFVQEHGEPKIKTEIQNAAVLRLLHYAYGIAADTQSPSDVRMDRLDALWSHITVTLEIVTTTLPQHARLGFGLLTELGSYLFLRRHAQEGLDWYRKLRPLVPIEDIPPMALRRIAVLAKTVGSFAEAHEALKTALTCDAALAQNPPLRGLLLTEQGGIADAMGEPEQANLYYQQALTFGKTLPYEDQEILVALYTIMGGRAIAPATYQTAHDYLIQAIALAREYDDTLGLMEALQYLGDVYVGQNKFAEAASVYQESLAYNLRQRSHINMWRLINSILMLWLAAGRKTDALECIAAMLSLKDTLSFAKGGAKEAGWAEKEVHLQVLLETLHLPNALFLQHWEAGKAMSEEDLYNTLLVKLKG
jgi:predicted ATPase